MKLLVAESRSKAVAMISKNGKELGRGSQGAVYELGPTKVVKITFGSSPIGKELRFARKAATAGISPKIFESGYAVYGKKKKKIYYFIMEKLDFPNKASCGDAKLKQLFSIFHKLSKLHIAINDNNYENVMFSNKKNRFYIIDFGKAKYMRKSSDAYQLNMRNLISMMKKVVVKSKPQKWYCRNVSAIMKLISCHADPKTRACLSLHRKYFLDKKSVEPNIFKEMGKCCNGNPMVNHKCACTKH